MSSSSRSVARSSRPTVSLLSRAARHWRLPLAGIAGLGLLLTSDVFAQTPSANTVSTIAGQYAGSYTVGATCGGATSGSTYTAADVNGDGCPGPYAKIGASLSGMGVDGAGNVYFMDTSNAEIRKVDSKSGIVTRVAGAGTNCGSSSGELDSYGGGCPLLQTAMPGAGNVRGMNVDYYGNVIVPVYSGSAIEVLCLTQSPLCPIAAGASNPGPRKQVGYAYHVAGCIASATSGGTAESGGTAYTTDGDGAVASPFENLAGDVADWGSGATGSGTCSASVGSVDQPRNATADKYGNVWIADTSDNRYRVVLGPLTSTFFTGNNPMYAVIQLNPKYPTAHYGYIYPILGGFSSFTQSGITYNVPTSSASACESGTGASAATSTDAYGDGCLWFSSTVGSSIAGINVDYSGNAIFMDTNKLVVRVLYVGGTAMANLIHSITGATASVGTVYEIEGTITASTTGLTTTPTLTSQNGAFNYDSKGAVDQYGNIYIGNNSGPGVDVIDANTGYIRLLFASGSNCAGQLDTHGDGCTAGAATFTSAGGSIGMPIGVDNLNNVYLADNGGYIRKVLSTSLYPIPAGSSFTQSLLFHEPAGTTSITAALENAASSITLNGSPTCVLNTSSSDNTADCTVSVKFSPTIPGLAQATLVVTNVGGGGSVTQYTLTGNAPGAALVVDGASTLSSSTFNTTSVTPKTLAADGAGNLYTVNTAASAVDQINSAGVVTSIGTSYPTTPLQTSVDPYGNVYITGSGTANITKLSLGTAGGYTASTFTNSAAALPQAVAFDPQGNMYVADASTKAVYQIPVAAVQPGTSAVTIATGLNNPTGLIIDGLGNLIIADTGNSAVYRVSMSTLNPGTIATFTNSEISTIASAAGGTNIVTIASLIPVAIASDPGGNIYIQDGTSKKVFEIPYQTSGTASATSIVVHSSETTPSGVAVIGTGQIFVADSGAATISTTNRTAPTYAFGTNGGTANGISGTFSNAGSQTVTGYAETNSDFVFDTSSIGATTCGYVPATSGGTPASTALYAGGSCTFNLYYNQGTTGNPQSGILTPITASALSQLGTLTATGTDVTGITWPTSTTITQQGSGAIYKSSGTEATFTVTVSNTSGTNTDVPTGSVTVNLTGCTGGAGTYPLTSGSATVNVSGCPAGSPKIAASYAGATDTQTAGSGFGASSGGPLPFSITQASTTVTWTPGSTTQQYSAAVGSGPLNATAASSGSAVPGVFVYTATPSGGSAQNITSSSFLPIGTYALGVTFYPTDSVDFAQSTNSVSSYTVTQATTTAPVGVTQTLVAADGTGNYTTVQAAVNAVGVGGGSVYIKPGTYAGFISVYQPNVALRGLGGDPTKVILTHEAGAFGSTYPYTGEFQQTGINAGNGGSNGYQLPSGSTIYTGDQGSATLTVLKGVNTTFGSSTTIPNNFYSENLSIINGYDTDTTTTTTTYETSANGTCAINQSPAMTYSAAFNAQVLCGSQALAVAIQGDLAVFNNVYATSLQDTIYAASQGSGSNGYTPSREYWFRGKVAGDVDYIFGDAAVVFDYASIYSAWHGNAASGTDTIHAQEKFVQTGSTSDYLSGYIMNSNIFTSQSTGMTSLYFGRPYANYSTWVMLNSYIDQVNPLGYTTGLGPTLTNTTFLEYNDSPYTDPATNAADLNGVAYLGTGGNTGSGVTGPRETASTNPGTPEAGNSTPTSLTLAQAQAYFPNNWLGQTVSSLVSTTQNWVPTTALATQVNAFIPAGTSSSVAQGTPVTILMRPLTPGLGAVTNGTWTIPTGKYSLSDSFNGGASYVITAGTLDASGEAYFTTSTLNVGTHSLTWTYNGDSNFAGSTTSTAYTLTITGTGVVTTIALSTPASPIVYGQSTSITATVTPASGTATGNVTLFVDGVSYQTQALSSNTASFTVTGLSAATHYFTASYAGTTGYQASSTTANDSIVVSKYPLTVTGSCSNRQYDQPNSCSATVTSGTYQYSDTQSTVFSTLTGTTTAARDAAANTYTATPSYSLTTAGSIDYNVTPANSSFTVSGGAPQSIIFPALPNFPHGGSYQLTARSTSGQAVTYTVTAGSATVSGATLTVNAAGLVTVQASTPTDPTGDYAAATPVSQSFTAP